MQSKALLNALVPFKDRLSNSRVDVHVDNQVPKSALDDDGCKNSAINDVVKEILCHSRDSNFSIHTFYVPSERNPADEPLRRFSDLDYTPSPAPWSLAERFVGPHSFYLMAADSNCQKDFRVNPLPHYAPWPTPGSDGVNHFATPLFLDLIFIRFRRLYSLVHFCTTFSIKIFMVPSNLSCQICHRGRSGGRLFSSGC